VWASLGDEAVLVLDFVLMDRNLLPEGRDSVWGGGSTTILPAPLRVLQIAANHLLSRANDMLQSGRVLGSGSSVPDGDGGGEDGLNDGNGEVHHHCLCLVELI